MPFYDYKCSECDNEQEEFHTMSNDEKILCKECNNEMYKSIKPGYGGFKMTKDGTRRRDYKSRYGGKTKKSDNTTTPSESAQSKAMAQMNERVAKKKDPNDPYAGSY